MILIGNNKVGDISTNELEHYRYYIDLELSNRIKDHYKKHMIKGNGILKRIDGLMEVIMKKNNF